MKKMVEISLDKNGSFLKELKEYILSKGEIGMGYDTKPVIDKIISGVEQTLKNDAKKKNIPELLGIYQYIYRQQENGYPDFHYQLEEEIDKSLNRRIHSTTLERITDFVEDFISQTQEKQMEKKKIEIASMISPENECMAIKDYIAQTWDGIESLSEGFFETIWNKVMMVTQNQYDMSVFLNFIETFFPDEEIFINDKVSSQEIVKRLVIQNYKLSQIVKNIAHEDEVNFIVKEIRKDFPQATKIKPKGWKELSKNYVDYAGMEEFDKKQAKKMFKGMNSQTHITSSFEVQVSLPNVMYSDKGQGIKPLASLISSMMTHAFVLNERNNASQMLAEWMDLKKQLENNPTNHMTFEFYHPLNQVLFYMLSEKNYDEDKINEMLNIQGKKRERKNSFNN